MRILCHVALRLCRIRQASIPMVSGCVALVEFNSPPEFLPTGVEIRVEPIQAECKPVVGLRPLHPVGVMTEPLQPLNQLVVVAA